MSETQTVWHPWPKEQPHRDGMYLIAFRLGKKRRVMMRPYEERRIPPWSLIEDEEIKILYWAELPIIPADDPKEEGE